MSCLVRFVRFLPHRFAWVTFGDFLVYIKHKLLRFVRREIPWSFHVFPGPIEIDDTEIQLLA